MSSSIDNDRRNPVRELDKSMLPSFIIKADVQEISLIAHGKSNSNYKIRTRKSDYLIRLYSNETLFKELYILKLVSDLIPVPEILYYDDNLAVFSYIQGEMLSQNPELTGKAAEIIADISSISFSNSGQINPDGSISPWPFNDPNGFFGFILKNSDVQKWMGPARLEESWKMLRKFSGLLDYLSSGTSLVHGDFNPTNIITDNGKIAGIIDWEFCLSGNSFMDIGNLMRNSDQHYHKQIHKGLTDGGMDIPENWEELARLIDFSSHLEFLTTSRSATFKRKCIAKIDETLKHLC